MKQILTLFLATCTLQVAFAQRDVAPSTPTTPKTVSVKGDTPLKGETSPSTTSSSTPRPRSVSGNPGSPIQIYTTPTEAVTIGSPSVPSTIANPVAPPKVITLPKEIKAEEVQPVIVKGNEGTTTNWTDGYIEAVGRCFIDRNKFSLPGQAEELGKSGAEAIARRNLLIQVEKVRIIDTITLVNQAFERQTTMQILDGYIKNAYRVGNYNVTKDYVEVTMRMNLREGANSVAAAAGKVLEKAMADGGVVAPNLSMPSESQMADNVLAEGFAANNPLMLNIDQQSGGQPSLFPTLKFITEDGKELLVSTAPIMSQVKGGNQVMSYVKMAKDVLKSLNIKGYNVVDGILNADGSISIQLKDQPKAGKFLNLLKKYGSSALKYLPMVLSLF